jgi:hypothetical protein
MTRFLRCPRCRAVRLAESYPPAEAYCAGWDAGNPTRRVCPCGYQGPASAFRTIRGSQPDAPPNRALQLMLPAAPRQEGLALASQLASGAKPDHEPTNAEALAAVLCWHPRRHRWPGDGAGPIHPCPICHPEKVKA